MKFFWSFLLLSSFVCCVGETFKHPVKCISHQGERFDAPIHSAPAYRLAMERKADLMKIDVHYTRDAVPVLSHDGTLKRTMNWNVRIKDKTLEELKAKGRFVQVGGYKGEIVFSVRGIGIPTAVRTGHDHSDSSFCGIALYGSLLQPSVLVIR